MAEIHVEPKKDKGNNNWIWIVLVLIVAAAVVYYLMNRNNTAENNTSPADTTGYVTHPAATAGNKPWL